MSYILEDLVVDRVDLVDEGANSEAFIEVFKRKEREEPMELSEILGKMKEEHRAVVQEQLDELSKARTDLESASATISEQTKKLDELTDALAKANEALEVIKSGNECSCDGEANEDGVCKECGKPKKQASFDEAEVLKSMPESLREEFLKMRAQKEAAEEQVRKAAEEKLEAEAVAKAATMKSLPVAQETLVSILKNCDQSIVDVLSAAAAAIDNTALQEVGKSGQGKQETDAWSKIEAEAAKIAERDSVTKQRAIGIAIKEHPELYQEYLNGGAN